MSELIDRDEAIFATWQDTSYTNPWNVLTEVRYRIKALPTIDAVPVVRCSECKHHEDEQPGMVYCPKIVGSWVSENWFCADGERREG